MVIDNASSNPAPDGLFLHYPNVKFVWNKGNLGFAAANNQAMKLLNGFKWLALLNPDAFPEPDWLENLINAAMENPDYIMFASRQLMVADHSLLDGDGDVYHISGLAWRESYGKRKDEAICKPREIFSPCAAAALYRRDMFMSVGGFDEDFFCYMEDVDLGFRLRLMGHRCLLVPSAVVHHIGSTISGGRHSDFALYHGHRNLVWTFMKDMPGISLWLLLPLHLLLNLVSIIWFTYQGRGKMIWRAKRDAFWGLPKMWHKRQRIQKTRVASIGEILRHMDKRIITTDFVRKEI
ncbi:MAG: glycosyltransferase family 2 protein [Euryarchaeota archaeon]|nr:glycosyltransferase family 2 protein [Euryarchaeota archaeon]